ncbi:MAG TPA: hypothetical protein VFR47_06900 [Anaerolineales bacterium]|nr:hypothetical protein [Anaerolineales bacterium]
MLDPIQIPILLKAVDFVFEEGRKILEERRERRKTNENASKSEVQESEKDATQTPAVLQEQAEMKQDLLASKIEDRLWHDHEQEVQHLVRLLETYSRNYYLAREQYAKWGSALVPPIIIHNLTEAENSMLGTIKQLETVLSKVYKKDIQLIQ